MERNKRKGKKERDRNAHDIIFIFAACARAELVIRPIVF